MKRYTFTDLGSPGLTHVASRLIPGERLSKGGLAFHARNERVHADEAVHVHDDEEVFCIVQGRGHLEIDGRIEPLAAGDVVVIEPGENHHVVSGPDDPIINLWFHADAKGHPKQYPEG
jgi:mannose-6-phosphate isomerase-like protein (cupin superfamily)